MTNAPNSLWLREPTIADLDALLTMMAEFNRLELIPWTRVNGEPAVQRLLKSPDLGVIRYLVDGDTIVGYAILTWGFDLEWNGREAFLTELFLQLDARNRGLGSAAMALVETLAKQHGARAMHLVVRPDNVAAMALYRRSGFAAHHERVLLTKPLAK